jgi:hypothetical protein
MSQIGHGPFPSTSLTFIYSLLMLSSVAISTEPLDLPFSEIKHNRPACISEGTVRSSALYVICIGSQVLKFVFGFLYHAFTQSLHAKAGMMHEGRLNNMKILFHLQLDAQNSCLFTYNTFIKILYMFAHLQDTITT